MVVVVVMGARVRLNRVVGRGFNFPKKLFGVALNINIRLMAPCAPFLRAAVPSSESESLSAGVSSTGMEKRPEVKSKIRTQKKVVKDDLFLASLIDGCWHEQKTSGGRAGEAT